MSEPSVIRYCRSIGCDGFREFKKYLTQSVVLEQKFSRPEAASDTDDGAGDERFSRLSGSVSAALRSVSETDHFDFIDAVAKALMGSQTIAAFGLGGNSAMLAMKAQNRLFRLGLHVIAHDDSYMQRMTAATLRRVSSAASPQQPYLPTGD